MSYFKAFVIPLLPFLIELLIKLTFLSATFWWDYIDASTLLLTFSFWALFLLSRTPDEPPIPTDASVKDELRDLRTTFLSVVVVGFSLFGIVTFSKVIVSQIPRSNPFFSYFTDKIFYHLTLWTIIFCLMTMVLIIWKRDQISKVSAG